jgi:hypothetical protein
VGGRLELKNDQQKEWGDIKTIKAITTELVRSNNGKGQHNQGIKNTTNPGYHNMIRSFTNRGQ